MRVRNWSTEALDETLQLKHLFFLDVEGTPYFPPSPRTVRLTDDNLQ